MTRWASTRAQKKARLLTKRSRFLSLTWKTWMKAPKTGESKGQAKHQDAEMTKLSKSKTSKTRLIQVSVETKFQVFAMPRLRFRRSKRVRRWWVSILSWNQTSEDRISLSSSCRAWGSASHRVPRQNYHPSKEILGVALHMVKIATLDSNSAKLKRQSCSLQGAC